MVKLWECDCEGCASVSSRKCACCDGYLSFWLDVLFSFLIFYKSILNSRWSELVLC